MIWKLKNAHALRQLGLIPEFVSAADPRPAREQFNTNYAHGGGWRPFQGFTRTKAGLEYPDDPAMKLLASTHLRDELIEVYQYSWVCIVQPDGSYEISRMD